MVVNWVKVLGVFCVCMGVVWWNVKDDEDFDQVIRLVQIVNSMDMEVCVMLGMVMEMQAKKLVEAGFYVYNYNFDILEDYYKEVIFIWGYEDCLEIFSNVCKVKLIVCFGGIIGMGEFVDDCCKMLLIFFQFNLQFEFVFINVFVVVEGILMEDQELVLIWDMVCMVVIVCIVMLKLMVCFFVGCLLMIKEGQVLCFMVGVGFIFVGDKLFIIFNFVMNEDLEMFEILGLQFIVLFVKGDCLQFELLMEEECVKKENFKWSCLGYCILVYVEYIKKGKFKKKVI